MMRHVVLVVLPCAAALEPWMDPNDTPEQRAAALLANMTNAEKIHLLHGSGSGYIGNVEAQRGGAIPALKLNDGPQGFRCKDSSLAGTTTAWPSALGISATFSKTTARAWGAAMGSEFFAKGANVQLGPGMCVARVPRNGRNFEYLSGEDPQLGTSMVPPVIDGIQSQHVIANAKHYVNNNQETNRRGVSANVDERTEFEIYYPPFEAAARAGVGSVMCSYNKIRVDNGTSRWSCENPDTLQRDLKERLGFKGWVMSDWGATHSMSINAGLDQEMPGSGHMSDTALAQAVKAASVAQAKIDDSATRILTPMFQMGLFDEVWQRNNGSLADNVTSPEHNALARSFAAEGMVLLRNEGSLLPLPLAGALGGSGNSSANFTIAVIGGEAAAPTVHGGGSGHVDPYYTSAPLAALLERLNITHGGGPAPAPTGNNCSEGQFENDVDYHNTDMQTQQSGVKTAADCCALCAARAGCNYFTHVASQEKCWMKATNAQRVQSKGRVSGGCHAHPPPVPGGRCNARGVCVVYDDGSDAARASQAAAAADVAIVFVATTSHEGADRGSLSFDGGADGLVAAVAAAAGNRTVVAAVAPGAFLTPWRADVGAIVASFMPGQEYGNALVDVLLGTVNPSAKLPLTLPTKEDECPDFTEGMWPGSDKDSQSAYSERMLIGYRCYDAHKIEPAFPFGHGLSYTTFAYSNLKASAASVSVDVQNTGTVDGAETAQLYLAFPASAGEPPQQLKGFEKVSLKAGAKTTVTFALGDRATSVWDANAHKWTKVAGEFAVSVGGSSRDAGAAKGSFSQ
eukprot:g2356.t1